jgi:hypothetical protein
VTSFVDVIRRLVEAKYFRQRRGTSLSPDNHRTGDTMRKAIAALLLGTVSMTAVAAAEPGKDWIAKSNSYTQKLLDIDI